MGAVARCEALGRSEGALLQAQSEQPSLLLVGSPNNPTGNSLAPKHFRLLSFFK